MVKMNNGANKILQIFTPQKSKYMRVDRIMYFSEARRAGKIIDINYQKINFYLDLGAKIPCKNDLVVFIIRMNKMDWNLN